MARPRSEDREHRILAAAAILVAQHGVGAATAQIAKQAGVPHGSIFTYFETKAELLNRTYLALKAELTDAVIEAVATEQVQQAQLRRLWESWISWGVHYPVKRRALGQLSVSDQITPETRAISYAAAKPLVDLIHQVSAGGSLRDLPKPYVASLVETMVTITIEHMSDNPVQAAAISASGFEAMWKALT